MDVLFAPDPAPLPRYRSWFKWSRSSPAAVRAAEHQLLFRLAMFRGVPDANKPTYEASDTDANAPVLGAPDAATKTAADASDADLIARVGLVDIGEGRAINTLVIDRLPEGASLPTPQEAIVHTVPGTPPVAGEERRPSITIEEERGANGDDVAVCGSRFQDVAAAPGSASVAASTPPKRVLVLAHGYGAGLGFFYRCLRALGEQAGWRVFAIDWLGMAGSSRTPLPSLGKDTACESEESLDATEAYYVDSLEAWRERVGVERMTLLGHSFGGYLAHRYALKYPQRVDHLILASPAGVPESPPKEVLDAMGAERPWLFSVFTRLWLAGVTPQSLIRWAGPWGGHLTRVYTRRRFPLMAVDELTVFEDYLSAISAGRGAGEFGFMRLFQPGVFAKRPIVRTFARLTMPTTFIYGTEDWMDWRAAADHLDRFSARSQVMMVDKAGHHLYMDNPEAFSAAIISVMRRPESCDKPFLQTHEEVEIVKEVN